MIRLEDGAVVADAALINDEIQYHHIAQETGFALEVVGAGENDPLADQWPGHHRLLSIAAQTCPQQNDSGRRSLSFAQA
ncbi:MAG: hypothetical protein ACSHXI_15510 [Hoeflea sp.]|uniref:hypothetical protein n=1 Tax=Hoeflea sp. TaxID=1940281 RepID=UPI003EF73DC3